MAYVRFLSEFAVLGETAPARDVVEFLVAGGFAAELTREEWQALIAGRTEVGE